MREVEDMSEGEEEVEGRGTVKRQRMGEWVVWGGRGGQKA